MTMEEHTGIFDKLESMCGHSKESSEIIVVLAGDDGTDIIVAEQGSSHLFSGPCLQLS